jgi:phage terminase large subunit-like protein
MPMHEDDVELGRVAAEIEAAGIAARGYRAKDFWVPYPKQLAFFGTGRFRERGLFAGTQLGKTESAAYELACHLTGEYGPDWPGRRFNRAIKAWAVGENLKMTRDIMQKKLCGEPGNVEAFGSGMIPKDAFVGQPVLARGEGNAYDTVSVRHRSGGVSTLRFRTYSAGEMALQGESLDIAWCDEEPDRVEIYAELLSRTVATGGFLMIMFTPLKGMTGISARFREEFSPERTYIQLRSTISPPLATSRPNAAPPSSPVTPTTSARPAPAASPCSARARSTARPRAISSRISIPSASRHTGAGATAWISASAIPGHAF